MFKWLDRRKRERLTTEYLRSHPEDEPAVQAIYMSVEMLGRENVTNARQVAEMLAKRPMSDEEWSKFGPRWERAWYFIMR